MSESLNVDKGTLNTVIVSSTARKVWQKSGGLESVQLDNCSRRRSSEGNVGEPRQTAQPLGVLSEMISDAKDKDVWGVGSLEPIEGGGRFGEIEFDIVELVFPEQ